MLVSELAERSGVSLASIKFYIREGLLPAGRSTSRTRAQYDETHLARLRLIRALIDVGGLSIATARSVLAVIDGGGDDTDASVRAAIAALGPPVAGQDDEDFRAARREVDELVRGLGWEVEETAPGMAMLADALRTLRGLYGPVPAEVLLPYAQVARDLAGVEMMQRPPGDDAVVRVEWAVTGTVVFERVLVAWRRLAHEALSHTIGY